MTLFKSETKYIVSFLLFLKKRAKYSDETAKSYDSFTSYCLCLDNKLAAGRIIEERILLYVLFSCKTYELTRRKLVKNRGSIICAQYVPIGLPGQPRALNHAQSGHCRAQRSCMNRKTRIVIVVALLQTYTIH